MNIITARISNGMWEGNVFTGVCPSTPGGYLPCPGYPSPQPGQDGVSPRPGMGYPHSRTTDGLLATRRTVCLLRSRRRTFLLYHSFKKQKSLAAVVLWCYDASLEFSATHLCVEPFGRNISMSGTTCDFRVATAQGNQGSWMFIFLDRENIGNLPKNIKNLILHRKFNSQHRENFEVLKIKRHFRVVVGVAINF